MIHCEIQSIDNAQYQPLTMKLPILSFPLGILGDISLHELYKEIYSGITDVIKEDDVAGVQIYPAQWPRKILITVNNEVAQETLLISGLSIKSLHIELKDENEEMIKVTMKDAMIAWDDEKIKEILSPYGKISRVENEMIRIDGKQTKWKTGTRFIHMTQIDKIIPQRLSVNENGKEISVTIWYRRPVETIEKCHKCGGNRNSNQCTFATKLL